MFPTGPPYDRDMNHLRQLILGLGAMLLWGAPIVLTSTRRTSDVAPATRAPASGSAVQRVDVHGPAVQRVDVYQQPGPHGAAVVWIVERPAT